jgi:ABC-2 type transport system permease protein
MRRLLMIARREYLAYVRTPGFWLSLLLLPVGLSSIVLAPAVMARSTPPPAIAVVDLTGQNLSAAVGHALAAPGQGGKPLGVVVAAPGLPFSGPGDAASRLKPFLSGAQALPGGGRLDGAVILYPSGDTAAVDFWSRNVTDPAVEKAVGDAVKDTLQRDRLRQQGVNVGTLNAIDSLTPRLTDYSPKSQTGPVTLKDRLPAFAGFFMGMLLWMVILTGAGMLLNSVMEEKSSRILEVLLSSASVPEIMGGKILGVAAVTGTVLAFWLTIAAVVLTVRMPSIAGDIGGVLLTNGRWAYFGLYFIGGYLMFATLYVTIGAFCETSREAQTLLGPMMIIMSVPLLFMSQSLSHPDAPLLQALTWVPLFTPFMMAARVATDPPLWQVAATAALMAGVTALELWIAIPAFKSGALATGRFDIRAFFGSLARRGA